MRNIDIIKRLYNNYTKQFLPKILLSVFFSVLVAGSTASIAWLLDPAIKKIFIDKDQTLTLVIPLIIILAFSTKGVSLYFAKTILIRVGQEITKILQFQVMKSIIEADSQIVDNKHSGKFISHLTFDVGMITNLVSTVILNLTKDTFTLIGLLGVMFYQNWRLALFAIIMIPLASFAARSLGKRMGKVTTEAADRAGELTSYLLEIFKNHKIIKIFQKENFEFSRTEKFINNLKEKVIKIQTVLVRASPIMEILTGFMIAGLIFYSGKLILKNELDINSFFSFLAAMMLAYQPVRSLATLNMGINQGLAAAKRILPIIDMKNQIIETEKPNNLEIKKGEIRFNKVRFKYNDDERDVLKSIDLTISGGEMTSVVGHSGAGKSTILNLIPRFYDSNSGDILIDDQSIYKSKIFSLRSNISLVNQDTTLFDDTIKNNIAYAKLDASEDEIFEAAKLSFCDEFINKLPNKFDTIIGENGIRLSGGEKQRLSIARAMLKKSKIILLDEATSSLDAETESKIQEAIKFLTKNRTTLVIAHRLSTIMNSNKIYVVDDGKIAAEGNHQELIKSSEIYKNFYEKQLRKD
ncbi:MAG TPA: ABC transporter ATP-binding protein [Candidatus Pelagibacter sp.]|nr:ABC transporter ATP-binding protein [Candidatus Pelagibacter sp.]